MMTLLRKNLRPGLLYALGLLLAASAARAYDAASQSYLPALKPPSRLYVANIGVADNPSTMIAKHADACLIQCDYAMLSRWPGCGCAMARPLGAIQSRSAARRGGKEEKASAIAANNTCPVCSRQHQSF